MTIDRSSIPMLALFVFLGGMLLFTTLTAPDPEPKVVVIQCDGADCSVVYEP